MTTKRIKRWALLKDASQEMPMIPESASISGYDVYEAGVTGFNAVAQEMRYRREGPDLLIRGQLFLDTGTATEARISLPPGLTSISGIGNTTGLDFDIAGMGPRDYPASENLDYAVLIEPSKTYFTFSNPGPSTTATSKINGSSFTAGGYTILGIEARIPISGWEY
jgi:hypothetical protein